MSTGTLCYALFFSAPSLYQIEEYSADNEGVDIHDLTDGAGHGVLIATDNIWLTAFINGAVPDIGTTAALNVFCEILYRFKKVTLQEYIGIVQSQQQ